MRLWTYVLIPVAVALLVVLGLVAAVNSQPPAPAYAPPGDRQPATPLPAAPAAAVSTTAEQTSTTTTVQAPPASTTPATAATTPQSAVAEQSAATTRTRPKDLGPPVFVELELAPYDFIDAGVMLRVAEQRYYLKPKRNDTVVATYAGGNFTAWRESVRSLLFQSFEEAVRLTATYPETVPPEEFVRWLSTNYRQISEFYLLSNLGYVILVAYKNETMGIGSSVRLMVMDDQDFRQFTRRHLGVELDPCGNNLVLGVGHKSPNSMLQGRPSAEMVYPVVWIGGPQGPNAIVSYYDVKAWVNLYYLDIEVVGAVGVVGRCFADSFIDVPPIKTAAFVYAPEKLARHMIYNFDLYKYLRLLNDPERVKAMAQLWGIEEERVINFFKTIVENSKRAVERMEREIENS
ncbi:hypothetical protein PYWP30_01060 [Pyrobaculum sp. WP30]|nr:hypothetical protein PYWP30_01060 [Pyrobaculum sp. WP30]